MKEGVTVLSEKNLVRQNAQTSVFTLFSKAINDHHSDEKDKFTAAESHRSFMRKRHGCVMHPESRPILIWEVIMLGLLFYTVTVTPYEASFLPGDETLHPVLFAFDTLSDVLFIFDLWVQFSLAFYSPFQGIYIFSQRQIVRRYLMGWFSVDLVASFPYDVIAYFVVASTDESDTTASADGGNVSRHNRVVILRLLRLLRLLKLIRLARVRRVIDKLKASLNTSAWLWSSLEYLMIVVMVVHSNACFLHLIYVFERDNGGATWVSEYFEDANRAPTQFDRYVAALYWAIMTITTVGYGDVPAVTNAERIYMCFAMLWGAAVWAYIAGAITSMIMSHREQELEFNTQLNSVNELLDAVGAGRGLKQCVKEFFVHQHHYEGRLDKVRDLLVSMSPLLREHVAWRLCGSLLQGLSFFKNCPLVFVGEVALLLEPQTYVSGEHLIRRGSSAQTLYIIQRGLAVSCSRIFGKGEALGQDCLIQYRGPRNYTATALQYVDCLLLHRKDLFKLLGKFPEVHRVVRKEALKLCFRYRVVHVLKQMMKERKGARGSEEARADSRTEAEEDLDEVQQAADSLPPPPPPPYSTSGHDGGGGDVAAADVGALLGRLDEKWTKAFVELSSKLEVVTSKLDRSQQKKCCGCECGDEEEGTWQWGGYVERTSSSERFIGNSQI